MNIHDTQQNSICSFILQNNFKPYMVFISENIYVNSFLKRWRLGCVLNDYILLKYSSSILLYIYFKRWRGDEIYRDQAL